MKITNIRVSKDSHGSSRVDAELDGKSLWFSSNDIELEASPEAYASALLIPAASKGENFEIDTSIDPLWLSNFPSLQQLLADWWKLPKIKLITKDDGDAVVAGNAEGLVAQCFTGGVDSFYELATAEIKPDILVFIHGFDIRLKDKRRLEAFLPDFYEIAEYYGCKPIVVKTNYREHYSLQSINWEWCHGGALVAVGHVMAGMVGKLIIPSSYTYADPKPWGTHWELDPLWSSSKLSIIHADATLRRYKKIAAIADNALVQHYLRVCWENKTPEGNCSKCEKCVRSMISLEMCGKLQSCKAFDLSVPLVRKIRKLPPLSPHLIPVYKVLLSEIKDTVLAGEVERLIARGPAKGKTLRERLRALKRLILYWPGFSRR